MLKADGISVCINRENILNDVSFQLDEHDILMVIGPNGAGKTTLIKALMGRVSHEGVSCLNGKDIEKFSPKALAKWIGVLTQAHGRQFSFTVSEVVSLGRYAHRKGMFSGLGREDLEKIDGAMKLTGTYPLKERLVPTLSGGELQRVFMAAVFAQDPKILILDEPTNHLDLQYQIGIFETLKRWVKGEGRSVVAVVHDLNLAYTYGTKGILMHQGRVYACGSMDEVLSRENLKHVYGMDVALWMRNLMKHWN